MILERFSLDGSVAVVTGASSGLGAAFAIGLAEAGADIALGARRTDRLDQTRQRVEAIGRRAIAVGTDVTRPEDCERLVRRAVEELGHVDVLINNAGVATAVPALKETPDEFRSVVDINLMGAYWMAQSCARVMPAGSSIVNVSSVIALTTAGLPQAAYTASKAALLGLTRDLAQQWTGRKGIRVNAVLPGWFDTEMTADYKPGYLEETIAHRVLAGRPGELEECTAAVVFLASRASSYVTGAALAVDGGALLT